MNSTYDYPLNNDYMWFKMILESFKGQTNKDDCSGYFMHQFKIRNDVYDQTHFFKLCKEHTISLKEAFEVILDNNCQLPSITTDMIEQVYKCEFVLGYDESIELGIFEEKILLIEVKDFDNILNALNELILSDNNVNRSKTKEQKRNCFKYKEYDTDTLKLKLFYKELKAKKLIHQKTKLKDLEKVFSGKDIGKPIIWNGNISELYYLIKMLHDKLKLVEDLKYQKWEVAVNCFLGPDETRYNKTNLRSQKDPKATLHKIDYVLNFLK